VTKHKVDYRVYYEDTDAGGVVYHARYLHFAERGRTELLRSLGYENQKLRDTQGVVFVVRNMDIHFIKPAQLDDMLTVETVVSDIKNSSFVMNQHIIRGEVLIADINVLLVCVNVENFKPVRMPDNIKNAFLKYQKTIE
jgi:acyl-CoA thioester hydrolase